MKVGRQEIGRVRAPSTLGGIIGEPIALKPLDIDGARTAGRSPPDAVYDTPHLAVSASGAEAAQISKDMQVGVRFEVFRECDRIEAKFAGIGPYLGCAQYNAIEIMAERAEDALDA